MSASGPTEEELVLALSDNGGRDDRYDLPDRKGRPGRLPPEGSAVITRRITALALALGVFMAGGKLWLFSLTGSVGILSSLVHSLMDMVGAASSFIAVRFAARKPNPNYRFGFGKAESFSALFQVCLIGVAVFHLLGFATEALMDARTAGLPQFADNHVGHGHGHIHHVDGSTMAIVVMSIFCILIFWLLIAQSWAIRATGSVAVRGDRAHFTADLFGNLIVIVGLAIATFTEAHWADAIVGLIMAFWLLYTAYRVARQVWGQLMDRELEPGERKLIVARVMSDHRIRAVTHLRTRAAGPHLHMQMQLDLDPHLSLEASHDIVVQAEKRLMTAFPAADVLIHPHPAGCATAHGNVRFAQSDTQS